MRARMLGLAVLVAWSIPAVASAQRRGGPELGTQLGVTVLSGGGTTEHVAVPGAGVLGSPTLYVGLVASPHLLVQPQVGMQWEHAGSGHAGLYDEALQLKYLIGGADVSSPYVGVDGALEETSGLGGRSRGALGGAVGYRLLAGGAATVNMEARYRRWFADHMNELAFLVGLGIRLPGGR
jgi:hypothetical protein